MKCNDKSMKNFIGLFRFLLDGNGKQLLIAKSLKRPAWPGRLGGRLRFRVN
jgi:hypothetical protein